MENKLTYDYHDETKDVVSPRLEHGLELVRRRQKGRMFDFNAVRWTIFTIITAFISEEINRRSHFFLIALRFL